MAVDVRIDASDFDELARAFGRLPGEIKSKAMARSMRRMRDMARTRIVKRSAERVKIPQKLVREVTTAYFNAGGNTVDIIEKSGWLPLYKVGRSRQNRKGVSVAGRGRYDHAFLATMASGHTGIFMRIPETRMPGDPKREQIRELFGPNPASDVTNNQDEFLRVLTKLINENLAPRFMHELDRLLPR